MPVSLALGACGSDGASEADRDLNDRYRPSDDANVDDRDDAGGSETPSPGPADDAETPPPPCDEATTAAIQASIDAAIPATIDGVAFVIDPSCGERYFTHGPSKYGGGGEAL